jgi:hypothetical protein
LHPFTFRHSRIWSTLGVQWLFDSRIRKSLRQMTARLSIRKEDSFSLISRRYHRSQFSEHLETHNNCQESSIRDSEGSPLSNQTSGSVLPTNHISTRSIQYPGKDVTLGVRESAWNARMWITVLNFWHRRSCFFRRTKPLTLDFEGSKPTVLKAGRFNLFGHRFVFSRSQEASREWKGRIRVEYTHDCIVVMLMLINQFSQ